MRPSEEHSIVPFSNGNTSKQLTVADWLSVRMELAVIFLLGFLHLTASQKDCKNLKLFVGTREIALSSSNCTQYGTSACENGYSSLPGNLSVGRSVQKPRDFSAPMYWKNFTWGNTDFTAIGIKFGWKVPIDSSSRGNTKGYLISMLPAGSGKIICFLFDLQNADFTTSTNFRFEFDSFPMNGGDYVVEILSLPPPSDEEYASGLFERHVISIPSPRNHTEKPIVPPRDWKTWIQLQPHQNEGKIEVMFGYPNKFEANFTRFKLQLEQPGVNQPLFADIVYRRMGQEYGVYNFTEVPSGNYSVKVLPQDDYQNTPNLCMCWYYLTSWDNEKDCAVCRSTHTHSFYFNSTVSPAKPPGTPASTTLPSSSTGNPSTNIGHTTSTRLNDAASTGPNDAASTGQNDTASSGLSDGEIVAAVLIPVVGIALLLVGCYFWCKKYRRMEQGGEHEEKTEDEHNNNRKNLPPVLPILPEKAMKVPEIHRKRVLLLASEDHRYFHKAVQSFARFLELHCQCEVLFAPDRLHEIRKTTDSYCWLSKWIDDADFVIIVNSKAASQLYQAYQNNRIYKDADFGPEGDLFTLGIRHICGKISQNSDVSNVLMVHFEHTTQDQCLPIPALHCLPFKLPTHLKKFLVHIHNLNDFTMDLGKVNLPLQGNVEELKGGEEWLLAVQESQIYESSNCKWFQEKFRQPVPADQNKPTFNWQHSGESGFFEPGMDSDLGQRRLSSVSTHAQDPSVANCLDQDMDPGIINRGFTKDKFYPPSMAQSAYTIPVSTFTASESPPEIDQSSTTSNQFRMINERYEQEQNQQQCDIPQRESAFSDLTNNSFVFPQYSRYINQTDFRLELSQDDGDADCISLCSAQSV